MNATITNIVCDAAKLLAEPEVIPFDGCLAVRVPKGISALTLYASAVGQELIRQDFTWYHREPWAKEPIPSGIYDIRLSILHSNRKAFSEQKELLLPGEEPLPLAVAEIALIFLRKMGVADPLRGGCIRCRETASDGHRIALSWVRGRLLVNSHWDGYRCDNVWLAGGTFRR